MPISQLFSEAGTTSLFTAVGANSSCLNPPRARIGRPAQPPPRGFSPPSATAPGAARNAPCTQRRGPAGLRLTFAGGDVAEADLRGLVPVLVRALGPIPGAAVGFGSRVLRHRRSPPTDAR